MKSGGRSRVVITGMGMVTPIGSEPSEIVRNLREGWSAIGPIRSMDADFLVAEVPDSEFEDDWGDEDRATRMARAAAVRAVRQASRTPGLDPFLMGVAVGASGSGQFQNMRFTLDRQQALGPNVSKYHDRNVPHFQAERLAETFGATGPRVSVCSASTGSAVAIGLACQWLMAGKVASALAGGSEALTLLTLLGMGSLGIMSKRPTAPFGGAEGISFGEGAAFFVLETLETAEARGAEVLAEILGFGSSSDGYDTITNDPTGHGLARAIGQALRDAGIAPSRVDWIRASGTGHRDQDLAETLAIKEVFQADHVPPVSSIEPLIGHANGASPALGVGMAVLCLREGLIPATHHFVAPRPNCDLDYVPNQPRNAAIETVLCDCVAFGGSNAAIVIGAAGSRSNRRNLDRLDDVVITGAGIVSPVGHTLDSLAMALFGDRRDFHRDRPVARIDAFRPGAELPGVDLRRATRINQFAIVAAARALATAGLSRGGYPPERIGVMTGLMRGPALASEQFFDEILRSSSSPALGRQMLRMGRFSIASAAAHALKLLGPTATFSEGSTVGLQALCHAVESLRQDDGADAVVVISADEITPQGLLIDAGAGRLACEPDGMRPYDPSSTGSIAAEGAAAIVIERASSALRRGAKVLARVSGIALFGSPQSGLEGTADAITRSVKAAILEARSDVDGLDLVIGCGRGRPSYDLAERAGLAVALASRSDSCPSTAVASTTGVAESASGLFAVLAALLAIDRGEAPPISPTPPPSTWPIDWIGPRPRPGRYARVLVAGGTDSGLCASVVLDAATPM